MADLERERAPVGDACRGGRPAGPRSGDATWEAPGSATPTTSGGLEGWSPPGGAGLESWSRRADVSRPAEDQGGPPTPPAEGAIEGWAEPRRRRVRPAAMVIGGIVAVALIVTNLVGQALEDGTTPGPTTAASAGPTVPGTLRPANELAVGDCLVEPTEETFFDVLLVPCDAAHDMEVIFVGSHPEQADFPSDDAFAEFADTTCGPAFEAFTGSALDGQSTLEIGWFTPTEEGWAEGDRSILCYLYPSSGEPASQSYRGAHP